jgi:eukaryotic-like serine/threonine-protein kinase
MIEAGQVLQNRYLIQKQIGAGGMGTVYLATDKRLNSPVAIKETLFVDDDLKRAFEREAQLLNSLRHSALPRVIDYFTEGEAQFLVMEYIAGEDLSKMLKMNGVFALTDVLRWGDELLDALDYMHTQKTPVIHRDIKPQNLKLTPDGEIILLDFGLAKGKPGDTSKLSKTNSVFGYSRSYAPLEQIQGTGTDPRSDLYSLTATLYHLLTGKPPADALSRATAYVNGQPDTLVSVEKLNPKVPASVSQVISKGLELNAGLRFQSAEEMRETLQKAAENLTADEEITEFPPKKAVPVVAPPPTESGSVLKEETCERPSIEVVIPAAQEEVPRREAYYVPAEYEEVPQKTSWAKYAGIAATILILGGGSAAWYASNQTTAGKANVNQTSTANTAANKKAETANSNLKTASANSAPSSQNAETKTAETANANKSAANKSATAVAVPAEKAPANKPDSEDEAPKPIIVKSAPPTAELVEEPNKDEEKRRADDEEQTDEAEDNDRNRRRRGRDDKPPDTRERRVNDNTSTSQKLPAILGAPPDN